MLQSWTLFLFQNQAGLFGNWILSTTPSGTLPCVLPVTLWVCVTPWPCSPFINCHTTSPHLPFTHAGPAQPFCHKSSSPPPKQQQPLSCCLAFPQASSSHPVQPQARPHTHNWWTVYSPFCPLFLVPLALRLIPEEKDIYHSELCATFMWHCRKKLWFASC